MATSMGSFGLSLGRLQGTAWVGQALDIQIPAQLDHNEDANPDCLGADVQYGETLLEPSRVSVRWVATATRAGGSGQAVRVMATVLIDEPIVSVNLRVGCQQKLFKRYVLFADVPTNIVEPPAQTRQSVQSVARAATPAVLSPAVSVDGRAETRRPAESVKVLAQPPAPVAKAPGPRMAKPRTEGVLVTMPPVPLPVIKPQRPPSKARLKLDPLDLLVDYAPVLRSSDEMLSLPQEDPKKRSEAAALWQALNASPDGMVEESERLQRQQRDLQKLRTVTSQNEKDLLELAGKTRQAESERYDNALVYSLIALWIFSLLVLFWVWRRMRVQEVRNWAQGLDHEDENVMHEVSPGQRVRRSGPEPSWGSQSKPVADQPLAGGPLTEVDLDLDLMESSESALMPVGAIYSPPAATVPPPAARVARQSPAAARGVGHVDFELSISPGARAIDSAELVDARQQAEFFMSLGQYEKAIEILTTRIAQVGESSPLVCLDLLKIYHGLGRQAEFDFMRNEFNHWFAGRVPEYLEFGNTGRSLERYPEIMQNIVSLWPAPEVLEYIESCIYQKEEEGAGVVFDLQAYLDLLFLHGVAKRLVRQTDAGDELDTSESLRISPRMQASTPSRQTPKGKAGEASTQPTGAHLRGSRRRGPSAKYDAEMTADTQVLPVIPMPVVPSESLPTIEHEQPPATTDSTKPDTTDFNFYGLR